jgi:argonaute-like protein implicated in RNA metabolism and viral defense
LYFSLKHRFTNEGIPCQVVTKDLIINDNALKFSLGNIALQMFAKGGGIPWKMKPATSEYLIIGIGQSYNIEIIEGGNKVEKNITYSVLTDSSGIFKDLQVLSEGVSTDDSYYLKLVNNIAGIINNGKYKKIAVHTPFRLSKDKVLDPVVKLIDPNIELSVLVINDKTDFFGFDASNNGLVPFESTFIKLSAQEFLVWFEGIQPSNPKITKRFGNPLLIKFWYTNNPQLFKDIDYKESLLQDCINLSGANWRGFKAKQLPVSVFYCQRISEFIGKFRQYELSHIEINNLKPWFL